MWRFRKSFSPIPGVRLTLSPSGVSTSVGVGPFRLTSGARGTHLTTRVPGTGLSYRQTLAGPERESVQIPIEPRHQASKPDAAPPQINSRAEQIESAGSGFLTTQGLEEFKELLGRARSLHADTTRALEDARSLELLAVDKYDSWRNGWFLRRVRKATFAEIKASAEEARARSTELEEQLRLCRIGAQIEFPQALKSIYARFSDCFAEMARSDRIWDTVSQRAVNQFVERSSATRAIERRLVCFKLGSCEVIESELSVPHLENANGGDLFLFPFFVVYFAGERNFALLEYKEIRFAAEPFGFIEQEALPGDASVIGKTWAKVNKDGSPDRRFRDNYEIPIAQYATLIFKSDTGLNEEYLVSNAVAALTFAKEWAALLEGIKRIAAPIPNVKEFN